MHPDGWNIVEMPAQLAPLGSVRLVVKAHGARMPLARRVGMRSLY